MPVDPQMSLRGNHGSNSAMIARPQFAWLHEGLRLWHAVVFLTPEALIPQHDPNLFIALYPWSRILTTMVYVAVAWLYTQVEYGFLYNLNTSVWRSG